MKKIIQLLTILLFTIHFSMVIAQTPQAFKYQAVARDITGKIVVNQKVSIRISILNGTEDGSMVYMETHTGSTNDFGMFSINIGGGTPKSGIFKDINWGNDKYFLSVDIDITGGSKYQTMGVTQLLSVPYALYAEKSGSGDAVGATGPTGPTGLQGESGINGEKGDTGPFVSGQAEGDILYYHNNQWTILQAGNEGEVLTMKNGIPQWSAGASAWICGDLLTDSRDSQQYSTVQIGEQCWMQQNLNIGTRIDGSINQTNNSTIEKYCYDNDEANCNVYGGLYQWDEIMNYVEIEGAQGICPTGWHIPSDGEWKQLELYLGMSQSEADKEGNRGTDEGGKLKEIGITNWISPNVNATNSSGFTALPGGTRITDGSFYGVGGYAYFWTGSPGGSGGAWSRYLLYFISQVSRYYFARSGGFSVRCVKD
ncbi:MAG: hypothetical protein KA792_06060 [Bacteroidales bacterium]|nr:hypothetical protein [Bacteroidales bacterium]